MTSARATDRAVGPVGRLRERRSRRRETVYQITGARRGVRDDVDSRMRRYLFSMGVRTGCFVGAVLVGGWLRWVLLVGALVLPYVSVVFANGGRERIQDAPLLDHAEDRRALQGPDRLS